ncbi:MAG: hypothetical protein RR147_06215 [Oscillospiraceae bacterium]
MEQKLRRYVDRKFAIYPKTNEILELREELFSMMRDKYRDYQNSGMSKEKSYKKALTFMDSYKQAIREVEKGSELGALRKKLIGTLTFSALYFIVFTGAYLYVSMVLVKSFERTWLIGVAGAFIYLIYLAATLLSYARMFDMQVFARCMMGFLFFSFIPPIYVFPNLFCMEMLGVSGWAHSWLIIPIILFIYVTADLIVFARKTGKLAFGLELAGAGLLLTTAIYLIVSYFNHMWSVAWIIYLLYLAVAALVFYICKIKSMRKK